MSATHTTKHSSIYDHITQSWVIPSSLRYRLSNHYILHWSPEFLFETWGAKAPITREGITYLRIYHDCSHAELTRCKVVLLSFRKLPDIPYGYVLLTPARSLASRQAASEQRKIASPNTLQAMLTSGAIYPKD